MAQCFYKEMQSVNVIHRWETPLKENIPTYRVWSREMGGGGVGSQWSKEHLTDLHLILARPLRYFPTKYIGHIKKKWLRFYQK